MHLRSYSLMTQPIPTTASSPSNWCSQVLPIGNSEDTKGYYVLLSLKIKPKQKARTSPQNSNDCKWLQMIERLFLKRKKWGETFVKLKKKTAQKPFACFNHQWFLQHCLEQFVCYLHWCLKQVSPRILESLSCREIMVMSSTQANSPKISMYVRRLVPDP